MSFARHDRVAAVVLTLAVLLGGAASSLLGAGADREKASDDLFSEKVQPVLKQQCLGCHGEGETFGKLDLRTRDALLKGGVRGPALVPGQAEKSLLFQALEQRGDLKMPPTSKLPAETVAAFRDWINAGAPFAEKPAQARKWGDYAEEDIWAFRPVKNVQPPSQGIDGRLVKTPVDAFILQRLGEKGLSPAAKVGRRTLIRRATLDLTGLPPSPEEVAAFVDDTAPDHDAFKAVVERLLASPHYGERWGRHWLDVARYADTAGYSNDFERPNAWRYRDYVVRAFNNDKPYDRFILEQIAGDELFPDDAEALIATGFLRTGPWEHTGMSVAAVTRQMWLDDVTHATATAFLGLTLGCARCHDHKFDPIPTKDYYRMQAVFATTAFARRPVPFLPEEHAAGFEEGRQRMHELIAGLEAKIDEYKQLNEQRLQAEHETNGDEDSPTGAEKKLGLTPEERQAEGLYSKHRSMYKESALRYEPLVLSVTSGLVEDWNDVGPNGAKSYLKKPDYENVQMHVLVGGSLEAQGDKVEPGVLAAIEEYSSYRAPEITETPAGRRTKLAQWIADARNPLTARVMANRVWQYHFGKGLVENANNFGKMGKKPTHPELLDWLAAFFVEQGWSVKALHRVIMLSETYQRSSEHPDHEPVSQQDPENDLLSFFSPRRVEAEVLRDSMLWVSGELSSSRGGPGTYPQINQDVAEQPLHAMGALRPAYRASPTKKARDRRSVYSFQQRSLIDPMIEVFNGPPLDFSCERRDATTVPTQAFSLLNSELSYDLALAFADRLRRESESTQGRIQRAFELAYGRLPSPAEMELSRRHVEDLTDYHRGAPPAAKQEREPLVRSITSELTGKNFRFEEVDPQWEYEENLHPAELTPETRALADLALVLFNSNEFAYVY